MMKFKTRKQFLEWAEGKKVRIIRWGKESYMQGTTHRSNKELVQGTCKYGGSVHFRWNDEWEEYKEPMLDTSTAEGFQHVIEHFHEHGVAYLMRANGRPSYITNLNNLVEAIKDGNVYHIKEPRQPQVGEIWEDNHGARWAIIHDRENPEIMEIVNKRGIPGSVAKSSISKNWKYIDTIDLSALKEQDHE